MTQSGSTLRSRDLWLIGLTIVAIVCLFAAAVSYQSVRVAMTARKLYSADHQARCRAGGALASMGVRGRLALFEAVAADDDEIGGDAEGFLHETLNKDIAAGRDIEPVVRAAIEGMSDPEDAGRRCAGIASEGWALGMLDEQTKRAIVRRCLEVKFEVRPEYPVGKGGPRMRITKCRTARALWLHYRCYDGVDGQYSARWSGYGFENWSGGSVSWDGGRSFIGWAGVRSTANLPQATRVPGRHTVSAKVEVELEGIATDGRFQAVDDVGWKMEFETDAVAVNVAQNLPDDYLQAAVTPEFEELIRQSVKLDDGSGQNHSYNHGFEGRWVRCDAVPALRLERPLPFDLAFRPCWYVAEKKRSYTGYNTVLLKGETQRGIQPSYDMLEDMTEPGEHVLTIRITLEPSLEAALNNPEVEAYWPRPIELPEIALKVKVTPRELGGADPPPLRPVPE